MRFRGDIQGLRAVAVLAVLAFHADAPFARGGYSGVDVFFVISGFLITGLMLRDQGERRFGLAKFYARRVRRILPAATLVILATLALSALRQNAFDQVRAAGDARAATLFYSNIHFVGSSDYFNAPNGPSIFQQFWSLSVEEQFYFFWPAAFGLLWWLGGRHRRRVTAAFLAVASVASFAINLAWVSNQSPLSHDASRAFYLLPARIWELGLGALLAFVASSQFRIPSRWRQPLQLAGLAAIALAIVGLSDSTPYPGMYALLPVLGAVAVVAAGMAEPVGGLADRWLSGRVAQAGGRYSYSLYLWHWPVLLLVVNKLGFVHSWPARLVVTSAISIPLAVVTYHLIENPLRSARLLRVKPARALAFGTALIVLGVSMTTTSNGTARSKLRTTRIAAVTASNVVPVVSPTDFVPRNLQPPLLHALPDRYTKCETTCGDGKPSIVLVGDSHAEHLAPGLERAAKTLGVSLQERSRLGCPWIRVVPARPDERECEQFKVQLLEQLRADPPALIVFSTVNPFADQWKSPSVLTSILQAFPSQSKVAVVSFTPHAEVRVPLCLADHLNNASACDLTWWVKANQIVAGEVRDNHASFLDLAPVLCVQTRCPAISGNTLVWADAHHLTAEYSDSLGPWLAEQLRPLLPAGTAAPIATTTTLPVTVTVPTTIPSPTVPATTPTLPTAPTTPPTTPVVTKPSLP